MDSVNQQFKKSLSSEFKDAATQITTGKDPLPIKNYGTMMTSLSKAQKEVKEEDYDEFFDEVTKVEAKEATGSASSGSFEKPMFTEPVKNTLFQPDTETKLTKSVNEDEIPGGLADGMTVGDLASKHEVDIEQLLDKMEKGVNVEMEHTNDTSIAIEIAMDHIYEDLNYYDKLEKIEGDSHKEESTEATTSSSAGVYDAPFGAPKRDPLKIDTPKSVYNNLRSVKDKNFPKFGGPGSTFVKIKDKCKKFPYCNQGDIKALEFFENNLVKEAIKNISNRYSLNEDYIKGVILENTNIYYKNTDMNKELENMIDGIVDKVLSEEIQKKVSRITESDSEQIDEMEEYYETAKSRKEERLENMGKMPEDRDEFDGRDSEVVGVDSNIKDQRKEMSEEEICSDCGKEICECGGGNMYEEEVEEGNAFSGARAKAIENGEDTFEVDGKTYKVTDEEGETTEATTASSSGSFSAPLDFHEGKKNIQLSEEDMIDLIEKIIEEQKIEGITSQNKAFKQTKKDTDSYMKELTSRLKDFLKGSNGKYEMNPKKFPSGNGDLKDDKMMYTASDGVEEYIKQIARSGGQENLSYDQIKPDEEWLDKNILGSSDTGNNPEWANAVATDVGDEVKDRKDKNILAKLKDKSYNKATQPVSDIAGHNKSDEKFAGIEVSESKKDKNKLKINENIDRMKKLFSHNYKSQ